MNTIKDFSLAAINAGFITVLVGFTSSAVIVFQAAQALGATPAQISSWILALCLGMGITGIALSLKYRAPITTAWSTSGAAMLATGTMDVNIHEAIGAFLLTGVLITLVGFSGWFERIIDKIPKPLAAGMLSGILLQFGIDAFAALGYEFLLVFGMLLCYLISHLFIPRYSILLALIVGVLLASQQNLIQLKDIDLALAKPVYVQPDLSLTSIFGIAIPLFVVTMASQNLPGLTVLRASDYKDLPVSPLIGWTGVATTVLAPFGAYAINLATITSAICIGKEAHEDPDRRYTAGLSAGIFYILAGIFGATIVSAFAIFPQALIAAIAGLALLGTIGNALTNALSENKHREAALITFLVTASGIEFFGIGSAFWGMVVGIGAFCITHLKQADDRKSTTPNTNSTPNKSTPQISIVNQR